MYIGITLVLFRCLLSVLPFWPRQRFEDHAFRFEGRAKRGITLGTQPKHRSEHTNVRKSRETHGARSSPRSAKSRADPSLCRMTTWGWHRGWPQVGCRRRARTTGKPAASRVVARAPLLLIMIIIIIIIIIIIVIVIIIIIGGPLDSTLCQCKFRWRRALGEVSIVSRRA